MVASTHGKDRIEELRIGILVIGSLYWDSSPHRSQWRRQHLNCDGQQHVKVPIRYGRRAESRNDTYTMVFSPGLDEENFGTAIAIPCRSSDLVNEAECLWTAERRYGSTPNGRILADWGRIAVLANPERPASREIQDRWSERVSREPEYRHMAGAADEGIVVDEFGFLNILWPVANNCSALDLNALLVTATCSTLFGGSYASIHQIADAWTTKKGKKSVEYFWNRMNGITTYADYEIETRLRDLRKKVKNQ